MFTLSTRSLNNLKGVHPDMVKVVKRALELTDTDFMVGEGVRTVARQKKLVAEGKSKTMNSRHIPGADGLGKAVDLWVMRNGVITWDVAAYVHLSQFVLQAAQELGIKIRWGGDWNMNGTHKDEKFFDGPHYELQSKFYP